MKKTLVLTVLVLLTIPVMSQGKKYTKAMKAAVQKMNAADNTAGELDAVGDFEKIALDYQDQWLPCYHAARILVTSSFEESETDQREAMLDRANTHVIKAEELVPEESEIQ
jgi:hypothetical protein